MASIPQGYDKDNLEVKYNNDSHSHCSNDVVINQERISTAKPKKIINVVPKPRSTFEQHQELVTGSFAKSGVEKWLQSRGFQFVADTAIDPNGDSVFPIDEFLRPEKHLVTKGHQARANQSALLMFNEDGSAYQAIVNIPGKEKPYQYLAPTGAGNMAFLPHVPKFVRRAIVDRHQINDPEFLNTENSFWDFIADHPEIPIIITEGVKKALSLLQQGYVAISVYGYRCLHSPDLDRFLEGRKVVIAMDSDPIAQTRIDVGTGVIKGTETLKDKGARVSIATWDCNSGKGIDDLWVNGGDSAVYLAIANSLSPTAFSRLLRKFKKDNFAVLLKSKKKNNSNSLPDQAHETQKSKLDKALVIQGVDTRSLNTPLLTAENLKTEKKLILVLSPKATGKNKAMSALIQEQQSTDSPRRWVGVSPAIKLSCQLGISTGLPFVNEDKDLMHTQGRHFGHVSCFHSFKSTGQLSGFTSASNFKETNQFYDEADQIRVSLLDPKNTTLNRKKGEKANPRLNIMETITNAARMSVSTGGQIYLMSADLTAIDLNLWLKITGLTKDDVLFVENTYVKPQGSRTVYFAENPADLLQQAIELVKSGQKVIISATAQQAKSDYGTANLEKVLKRLFPDLNIVRVDSDTSKILGHPAVELTHGGNLDQMIAGMAIDILIFSPVWQSGVSIEQSGLFDARVHFSSGNLLPSLDLQITDRYRPDTPLYIYAPKRGQNGAFRGGQSQNPSKIFESLQQRGKAHLGLLQQAGYDSSDFDFTAEDHWLKAYCWQAALGNSMLADFLGYIKTRLESEGYTIEGLGVAASEELKALVKESAKEGHLEKCEAIATSKDIDDKTSEALERKTVLPVADMNAVSKHKIHKLYDVEVTPQIADQHSKGWHGQIQMYYWLTVGRIYLEERDKKVVEGLKPIEGINQNPYLPDLASKPKIAQIKIFETLGIDRFWSDTEKLWTDRDESLLEFVATARKYQKDVHTHLNLMISDKGSPISVVQTFLKKIGLKLVVDCSIGKRGEQKRAYRICSKALNDGRSSVFEQWVKRDTGLYLKPDIDPAAASPDFVSNYDTVCTTGNNNILEINSSSDSRAYQNLKAGSAAADAVRKDDDLTRVVTTPEIAVPPATVPQPQTPLDITRLKKFDRVSFNNFEAYYIKSFAGDVILYFPQLARTTEVAPAEHRSIRQLGGSAPPELRQWLEERAIA